jgi:hypothetical protein
MVAHRPVTDEDRTRLIDPLVISPIWRKILDIVTLFGYDLLILRIVIRKCDSNTTSPL